MSFKSQMTNEGTTNYICFAIDSIFFYQSSYEFEIAKALFSFKKSSLFARLVFEQDATLFLSSNSSLSLKRKQCFVVKKKKKKKMTNWRPFVKERT